MKKNENAQAAGKENTATQTLPMKVDVKIGSIRPTGSIRATASVNLNDCFAIRNVKIIDSHTETSNASHRWCCVILG